MKSKHSGSYNKNKLENSKVSAGERVHIGDQIVNNNYGGAQSKKSSKSGLAIMLISVTLVSITLFSFSFSKNEFIFLQFLFDKQTQAVPGEEKNPNGPIGKGELSVKDQEHAPDEAPSSTVVDEPVDEPPVLPRPKKPAIGQYINESLNVSTAFWNARSSDLPAFQRAIEDRFTKEGIAISNRYFRPAFKSKFGRDLGSLDLGDLTSIGLFKHLNCICQMQESIKYEPNEVEGMHMVTARGRVNVLILNLKDGQLRQYTFTEKGAGISESAALESLEEHLLQSPKLAEIAVQKCQ